MSDMLVRLYTLEDYTGALERVKPLNISIQPSMTPNLSKIREWIASHFSTEWADEATRAILASPATCFLAVREGQILGFACYDATAKGYFGPTGVDEAERGQGIGQALLVHTLQQMANAGYGYAVIGGASSIDFYHKGCGATVIENSKPGIYRHLL